MDEQTSQRKRSREDLPETDSPEAKRIREDLLGLLDDSDSVPAGCRDSDVHGLDSVIRSFEQELSGAVAGGSPVGVTAVADLTSDFGVSLPELGYLLEASDDELGLPTANPAATESPLGKEEENPADELVRDSSESTELGGLWPSDEGTTGYDSFGFGIGEQGGDVNGDNGYDGIDYVALDGIFDCSDVNFGPSDCTDISWRPETLPAL